MTNYLAANALYELGAKRVVLAREMDLQAVRDIRANIPEDMDIECFVHGAMCMAFLRALPVLQLPDRPRRQPRRMRPALPLEVLNRGGEAPGPLLPDRTDPGRRLSVQLAGT